MLVSLRRLPCRTNPSCLSSRSIAFTAARRAEVQESTDSHQDVTDVEPSHTPSATGRNSAEMLDIFLNETGSRFKTPVKPNNWLGGDRPFPLNHSFKPPIPVSDALRTQIYQKFMSDPKTCSVRALAATHGLSLKRIDAILRLKGLEEHFKQEGKTLQTGLLAGMEWCLGVKQHVEHAKFQQQAETEQYDVREADALMEAEGNDPARLRYRKMFWEPVADGKDPVVPLLLEKARTDGIKYAKQEELSKNHPRFLTPQLGTSKDKVKMVAPPGRPMIKFSDVGGKFINKDESLKRIKKIEHRGALKSRRRVERASEQHRLILEAKESKRTEKTQARLSARAASAQSKAAQQEQAKELSSSARNLILS